MDRWSIVPNRLITVTGLLCVGFALLSGTAWAQQSGVLAIRAGKIVPISGPEISNGIVIVRDGKIAALGVNVPIPDGAKVLDAACVMPGLIESHGSRGMDAPNENVPIVPFVNTADGVDPVNVAFE